MSELTVDQAINIALEHQRVGQLAEAEEIFRQILDIYPDQADALHLLGAVYFQAKRFDLAEARVNQALAIRPEPTFNLTLGLILQATARTDSALSLYQDLLAQHPEFIEAYLHLAVLQSLLLQHAPSALLLEEALRRAPDHPIVQSHLGIVLCHLKRWEDAIPYLRRAITLAPRDADVHASLAAALYATRQLEPALAACHSTLALNPKHLHAHSIMTMVLHALGRPPESLDSARQAATLLPNEMQAQINFAESLRTAGKFDEAVAVYHSALTRSPHVPNLHNNLANIYKDQGQLDLAITAFRQALTLAGTTPDPIHFSNLLYTLQFHPAYTTEMIHTELQRYNDQIAKPLAVHIRPHTNDRAPARRLRIGYLSSEFRHHVVGLNLFPLLTNHDHSQFEIFCYSTVTQPDFYTFRFRQCADHWRDIQPGTPIATDTQLADLIRADQIDILLDLHLHLGNNRLPLFARQPAPVQISFAGYPGTTGLSTIAAHLTDPHLEPPPTQPSPGPHTSNALRIPSFWCYHPPVEVPVNDLPSASQKIFTFGNLNNFCKLNDSTYALWAQIMNAVPDSQLLLLAPEGSHRDRTRTFFQTHGIAPARIRFSPRLPAGDYYTLFHQIDLSLDSFPYNGHTTSLDSFFMGVPVTTLIGQTPVSRATWSQLNTLDLTILAGKTEREFIDLSIRLAKDTPWLATLRRTLRARMKNSLLMNGKAFAQNIEAQYRSVWEQHCATPK